MVFIRDHKDFIYESALKDEGFAVDDLLSNTQIVALGKAAKGSYVEVSLISDKSMYKSLRKTFSGVVFRPDFSNKKITDVIRHVVENGLCDYVVGFESDPRSDSLHQRYASFNHILAKFCAENKITVCISFSQFLNADDARFAQLCDRVDTIIELCEKFKVSYLVGSFARKQSELRNVADMNSFLEMVRQL